MSLTVRNLRTVCRVRLGREGGAALVDNAARALFARELSERLGPSLDRQAAVVRIRRVRVKLHVSSRGLTPQALAAAWARAFARALFAALAYPDGDGAVSLRRHNSYAAYAAAMLEHLAANGAAPTWQFPEIARWAGAPTGAAIAGALLDGGEPAPAEILVELARRGSLAAVLAHLDDLALEQIVRQISEAWVSGAALGGAFGLNDLVLIGNAAAAADAVRPNRALPFGGRRHALLLWAQSPASRYAPRVVLQALQLLRLLLEQPALMALLFSRHAASNAPALSPHSAAVLTPLFDRLCSAAASGPSQQAQAALDAVLEILRPALPSAASPAAAPMPAVPWLDLDNAGMLLMLRIADRLDWWRLTHTPEFLRFGGPRALQFFLAGVGMRLLGRWTPDARLDPAAALFAGMPGDPDYAGLKSFFAHADVRSVSSIATGGDWDQALDRAAEVLAHQFACLVRGFRQASRQAIVKQFVRMPGRVLLEDRRLLAVLGPSPLVVALRIAGMDAALEVPWLFGKRVEFVLEGL
jgi:hypothetical protein